MNGRVFHVDQFCKTKKKNLTIYVDKKINYRLEHTQTKLLCISKDIYELYEGDDNYKLFEVLPKLKNREKKLNMSS